LIALRGKSPPREILDLFERLLPGIWQQWSDAAGQALYQIDADVGGETTISSWYRSSADNRRVDGHPDSQHLVGLALDMVPGKGTSKLAISEATGAFREAGFIAVPYDRHVHVQTFPAGTLRMAGILDWLGI